MGFLRKLFSKIGRFFKKIWTYVKKIIAVVLVAILIIGLVYLPVMWAMNLGLGYPTILGFSIIETLMIGVGGVVISYMVMPNTTAWAVRRTFEGLRLVTSEVIETVTDIAGDVIEGVGNVAGRAVGSTGGLMLLAGAAAFLYLRKPSSTTPASQTINIEQPEVRRPLPYNGPVEEGSFYV